MANEKRLIDKKSAWKTAQRIYSDPVLLHAIKNTLDTTPTVDVVEVKHGRWLDVQETDMYVPDMKFTITKTAETCSNCKVRIGFIGAKQYLFDSVCPNCGAKMDGDGNA